MSIFPSTAAYSTKPPKVFIRCYWCFAGVFVPADLFYLMECDDVQHAIALQEIAEPPAQALTVNVTDPLPEVLRAKVEERHRVLQRGEL